MSTTVIDEKDKPFYIAIFLLCILAAIVVAGVVGAFYDKQLVLDYVAQIIGVVGTLVTAAVTYYFGTKSK